ncbi:MAG: AAA family ATPase, partial [Rhodothermales bacterium]|nr:AAA family ATPase [Rhodothermales bacterium]
LTRGDVTMGTAAYMSPEQVRGEPLDGRSDLWSLGLVLYEMLTGVQAFHGDYWMALLYAILNSDPPPVRDRCPEAPASLEAIVRKTLSKNVDERFEDADALIEALLQIHDASESVTALPQDEAAVVTAPPVSQTMEGVACAACGVENSPDSRFCGRCGVALFSECSDCGASNSPSAKFCSSCGSRLESAETADTGAPTRAAERRQLTLMSLDLTTRGIAGQQPDPEDLLEVRPAFEELCRNVVEHYDGHLLPYPGNRFIIYFGYPHAHEDDPHRAVRAGLGILDSLDFLNSRLTRKQGVSLSIRAGIHTGIVIAQDANQSGALTATSLTGELSRVADGVRDAIDENMIAITSSTRKLTRGFFDDEPYGSVDTTATGAATSVFVVRSETETRSRLQVAAAAGLTPLVGREVEVGMLRDRWELACDGEGQAVVLTGEPGIGKSRLIEMLKEYARLDPDVALTQCECSPYHQNTPFYPLVTWVEQRMLGFQRGDSPDDRTKGLERLLMNRTMPLDDAVPMLALLLSLPLPDEYERPNVPPEELRRKTIQLVISMLLGPARGRPHLLIVEDLHWADPSTLELLGQLVDVVPSEHLMLLVTCRSEFQPPWQTRSHITPVNVARLPRRRVVAMVHALTGKELPDAVMDHIVDKTDGVPIFVEELTRAIIESGQLEHGDEQYELVGSMSEVSVPDTLRGLLTARLDRLGSGKLVAQLAAVIGRRFSADLLAAIAPFDEEQLETELEQLRDAEVIIQRDLPPHATYVFKHALVEDAAYESLLKSRRREFHQKTAVALESGEGLLQVEPETIGRHYAAAGVPDKAVYHFDLAAQAAAGRAAAQEAVAHYRRALELVPELPVEARDGAELPLRIGLGMSLFAAMGPGAEDVKKSFDRSLELCNVLDAVAPRAQIFFGLWSYHFFRAELARADEYAREFYILAEQSGNSDLLLQSHLAMGNTQFILGKFEESLRHAMSVKTLYDPAQHESHLQRYGQNPRVTAMTCGTWATWIAGRPDEAMTICRETVEIAEATGNSFVRAISHHILPWLHYYRREPAAAAEEAGRLVTEATEGGYPVYMIIGMVLRGWGLSQTGQIEEGLGMIEQGLAMWRGGGGQLVEPFFLQLYAEALRSAQRSEEGLKAVDAALELSGKTGELTHFAETQRLRGDLLADTGGAPEDVEYEYRTALEMARVQGAASFELRAATSLARLLHGTARGAEAMNTLVEVYGRFGEGHDTADLKEAAALIG